MHYFQQVFAILKKASALGESKTASGVTLLGRARHVGPEAWLHTVFPPLDDADVNLLESEIGIRFPDSFRELLELTNGLNVFSDSLAIFGRRTSFDRSSEDREPYSVASLNLYERPADLRSNALLIGSYSFRSGFWLYMDIHSEEVFRCTRREARPLAAWPGIGEMLLTEIRRLDSLFDNRGMLRDPNAMVVPSVCNGLRR